jgi:L-alanine-DL-glutamate epimerase-like enolase superfamily enzyme
VPAYIAGGYYAEGKDLNELAEEMQEYVSWGAKAVKMKIGAIPLKEDAKRVKAVREAIGPDVKLLLDANCAYRYYEAIQFAKLVEEYEPFWFEEPVAPDDYEGLRKLADKTIIPIATGENEYTRYGFRDLIQQKAVPILNADACILGGITEFMKVAALAQAYDLDIAPHGTQDVHVHLVAAISNGLIVEFYPASHFGPLAEEMYIKPLELNNDGTVSPPESPGLGLELNFEPLAPYRVF